ncbi:MAG: hypothetical protein EPO21_15925 [Chloroflexota bacterium]|nr:MAG: hypothetical protein EPO21_15925 [Chloroflexota bacterium]
MTVLLNRALHDLPVVRVRLITSLMLGTGVLLSLIAALAFEARQSLTFPLLLQGLAVALFAMSIPLARRWLAQGVESEGRELAAGQIRLWGYTFSPWDLELRLLGVILLVALLARALNLGNMPPGLWFDEAQNGIEARRILEDPSYRPTFIPGLSQLPALFFYVMAFFIRIFGPDAVGVRAMSVTAGVFSVLGFYLLARCLFGARVGLVAAFLLATSRWHVNFSRVGMHGILTVLFEVFALYLVIRGLRTEKRRDFILAGLAMGLALHGYYASVMVPVLALLFIGHKAVFEGWRPNSQRVRCVVLMLITIAIVYSPLLLYAKDYPQEFFQRQSTVLVFNGKTTEESISAVLETTRKHLLMFSYSGDNNGRHNLPGAPMLDPITSALAILGLGYSLLRLHRSRYFLLVAWFFAMLMPGILSLDFEAPQSYRDIGVIPAVYLLVGVALFQIWRLGQWALGRPFRLVFPVALAGVAIVVGYINLNLYFGRQMSDFVVWSSFSAVEARVATILATKGRGKDNYVSPGFQGHPTLRFLASNAPTKPFQPQDVLPLRDQPARDALLLLDPSYAYIMPIVKGFYPRAQIREEQGPQGQPILYSALVSAADAAEIFGLDASYYKGSDFAGGPALRRRDQTTSFDWRQPPLPMPFSAEWTGNILIPAYDTYQFALETGGWAELTVDGRPLLESSASRLEESVTLAKGLHAIRLRARVDQAGSLKLLWSSKNIPRQEVPANSLFASRVPNNGLIGYYYRNGDFSGTPAFAQIDRAVSFDFHISPLPRPYSIEWRGKINLSQGGTYLFGSESIDRSWIYIDDQLILDNETLNRYAEAPVDLTAGPHDVRIRFTNESNFSRITVFWTPPGGNREPLPWERLWIATPPTASEVLSVLGPKEPQAAAIASPTPTSTPTATPTATPTPTPTATPTPSATPLPPFGSPRAASRWGGAGTSNGMFSTPRDLVIDGSDKLYVLDYGNQRIEKFSLTGEYLTQWGGRGNGNGQFQDAFALAVGPGGSVWVLDSTTGSIQKFDSNGAYQGRVDLGALQMYHPRGFDIDSQGNFYIADTGKSRILKVDPSGTLLTAWGAPGMGDGQFREPSDVAVDRNGNIYVADTNNNRIQKLDSQGRFVKSWVAPADSGGVSGPRLSLDAEGNLYLTGGSGQLYAFTQNGELKMAFGSTGGPDLKLETPRGIAVDRQGLVYVAESGANRIRSFVVRGP